jgi:hypothetical protein
MADFWASAAKTLGTVAPMLATAVGGPLAGAATSAIVNALGLPADTPAETAAAAVVGATPDQLIALKKADQEFAEKMRQLEIDHDMLSFDDRASARSREIAVKDHAPMMLAGGITLGFFTLLALMMFHDLPKDNQNVLNIMLGSLGAGFTMVLSYYYGASVPSAGGAPSK